jgi:hypothetical protein
MFRKNTSHIYTLNTTSEGYYHFSSLGAYDISDYLLIVVYFVFPLHRYCRYAFEQTIETIPIPMI